MSITITIIIIIIIIKIIIMTIIIIIITRVVLWLPPSHKTVQLGGYYIKSQITDRFRATVPFFTVLTIQWFNDGGLIR